MYFPHNTISCIIILLLPLSDSSTSHVMVVAKINKSFCNNLIVKSQGLKKQKRLPSSISSSSLSFSSSFSFSFFFFYSPRPWLFLTASILHEINTIFDMILFLVFKYLPFGTCLNSWNILMPELLADLF